MDHYSEIEEQLKEQEEKKGVNSPAKKNQPAPPQAKKRPGKVDPKEEEKKKELEKRQAEES